MISEGKFTAKDIAEKPDLFLSGHRACAGCAPATVLRLIMKATRGPTIVTNATGCMEVASTIYPYTSWATPWLHTAFETAGANASGIETALKILRKKGRIKDEQVDVIAFAGDGGTFDIGIQALSGAVERGHDFLYVLYDNEAYMNTGIQRSGGTPLERQQLLRRQAQLCLGNCRTRNRLPRSWWLMKCLTSQPQRRATGRI